MQKRVFNQLPDVLDAGLDSSNVSVAQGWYLALDCAALAALCAAAGCTSGSNAALGSWRADRLFASFFCLDPSRFRSSLLVYLLYTGIRPVVV